VVVESEAGAERANAEHQPRHVAWTLHRGAHAAELELRDVPSGVALIVDGDLRRSRLY
jgi:hypothetical protein